MISQRKLPGVRLEKRQIGSRTSRLGKHGPGPIEPQDLEMSTGEPPSEVSRAAAHLERASAGRKSLQQSVEKSALGFAGLAAAR